MDSRIIVAILSLVGTLVGSIVVGLTNNNKTLYRIEQLEKKQDMHNQLIERVYKIEQHDAVVDEEIKVVNHRISDLERSETE